MQNRFRNLPGGLSRPLGVAGVTVAACLALPASALAASFRITPHIANHTPTVNVKWPVELTVTRGRRRLAGSVRYQFLFDGSVVGSRPGHAFRHGVFRDTLLFPSKSLGEPLTLRILVTVPAYHRTEHIDWAIKTRQ